MQHHGWTRVSGWSFHYLLFLSLAFIPDATPNSHPAAPHSKHSWVYKSPSRISKLAILFLKPPKNFSYNLEIWMKGEKTVDTFRIVKRKVLLS
jgi:hypothetical protein